MKLLLRGIQEQTAALVLSYVPDDKVPLLIAQLRCAGPTLQCWPRQLASAMERVLEHKREYVSPTKKLPRDDSSQDGMG